MNDLLMRNTFASKYSILRSKEVNFSLRVASLPLHDMSNNYINNNYINNNNINNNNIDIIEDKPNEFKKSAIFLILPVMISMYSRLAQSCCICF